MAGAHFSRELFKRLEIKGIETGFVTVHFGLGNFRSIDVEDLTKHKMDSEQLFIDEKVTEIIDKAKDNKNNICAVGISTIKALETAATTNGRIKPYEGWTNKFIFPPYNFSVANSLITNFHLPYSSLLMVATAFGEFDLIMNAYDIAVKENYRFGSYGDAMLIID